MLVNKLNPYADFTALVSEVESLCRTIEFNSAIPNQLSLQVADPATTGVDSWWCSIGRIDRHDKKIIESEYTHIHPVLRGGAIERWVQSLGLPIYRLRLLRIDPRACYSVHRDPLPRIHLPVISNPGALIVFPERQAIHHLPVDGCPWWVDTRESHTAINCGLQTRIHLVAVTEVIFTSV